MMTMERLKPEAQRQIISDFYQKNVAKGKPYTVKHFRAMGLKKTQIYRVMKLVDSGEAVDQKKGQGCPRLLTAIIQLFRSIKSNIVKTANEGPYSTFH